MTTGDGGGGGSAKSINNSKAPKKNKKRNNQTICGLVMPISQMDNLTESHWLDVRRIVTEAIECDEHQIKVEPVYEAKDAGLIHARIVQNLYDHDIIVCDVSCKNPNVMFELGMRLAFDKPVIVIKDDKTNISFDASPIEHISYPRDLRFTDIVTFQKSLKAKVIGTLEASNTEQNKSFLSHFGKFIPKALNETEVSQTEYFDKRFDQLHKLVNSLGHKQSSTYYDDVNDEKLLRLYKYSIEDDNGKKIQGSKLNKYLSGLGQDLVNNTSTSELVRMFVTHDENTFGNITFTDFNSIANQIDKFKATNILNNKEH